MATLAAGGLVATACSSEVVSNSGSGASGSTTSNTAASSGAGGASNSSSGSGAGGEQVCGEYQPQVIACVLAPVPPFEPEDITYSSEISEIGPVSNNCFAPPGSETNNIRVPEWGNDAALSDAVGFTFLLGGYEYQVGFSIPGITQDMFQVGAPVDISIRREVDEFGLARGAIEVWVEGSLLASVASNTSESIQVSEGPEICYVQDQICGYEDRTMVVDYNGAQATLGKGETQEVGGLLVTNDHFSHLYDLGACNFAEPIDFTVGAVAAP